MTTRALYRYLASGERPQIVARAHPSVLLRPLAALIAAVLLAVFVWLAAVGRPAQSVLSVAAAVILAFVGVRAFVEAVRWRRSIVVLTDERIVRISGLFARTVLSVPLAQVTDVVYHRGVGGRLLGYGDIVVERATARHRLPRLGDPDRFYRRLIELLADHEVELIADDDEDTGPLPRVVV